MDIKKTKLLLLLCLLAIAIGLLTAYLTARPGSPAEMAAEPTAEETVETDPPEPTAPEPDWRLTLVNPWHALPTAEDPALTEIGSGQAVDSRCAGDLLEMMAAWEEAGLDAFVCSSYRSQEYQQRLFENKVQRLLDEGWDPELAPREAARVVALPGTSEHQLGLAVDIMDGSYPVLDDQQADTPAQRWLMAHSWEFGFILRYSADKSDITGIIYEPWHYRYVGREAAKEIFESGLCLEEYLESK